jgi:hypothetical protein
MVVIECMRKNITFTAKMTGNTPGTRAICAALRGQMSGKHSLELLEPRVMLSADGLSGAMIAQDPAYDLSALGAIEVAQEAPRSSVPQPGQSIPAESPSELLDNLFDGVAMESFDVVSDPLDASADLQTGTLKASDPTGLIAKTGGSSPKSILPEGPVTSYRNNSVGTILNFQVTGRLQSGGGVAVFTRMTHRLESRPSMLEFYLLGRQQLYK